MWDMFGVVEILKMKLGVFLINNVCGKVIDIDVFVDVFKFGYLVGVVIDVFLVELKFNKDEFFLLLCGFDNVILIFYVGGFIEEV